MDVRCLQVLEIVEMFFSFGLVIEGYEIEVGSIFLKYLDLILFFFQKGYLCEGVCVCMYIYVYVYGKFQRIGFFVLNIM